MTLYLPRAFDERDLARLDALTAAHPFVTLITVDDSGPVISHLPVLYRRDGDSVELCGHLARPNPQTRHRGRALAIFRGPHTYVSPSWYTDKAEQARVPTWNYVVAHLSGELEWFDDDALLGDLLTALGDTHEARVGGDWRYDASNETERVQLRGILGFWLPVDRIDFKAKLSQNHPLANRHAVIDRLAASADASDRDVAAWMRGTLESTHAGD
ncbi:FMN-binding negative transcriptional regulator [Lysobacter sp. TY2-98]|uniref:FMN-binding negative transcriptional regulator n=1 Tax=Lysobacter sp. TY2-98 TaxID=2290922 RepID=UPI000E2052EA|nr:FMN-binding negative transcriptional regulator [Lysobacter sp. TY2-98]AXK71848.1 FMN-binding negative transcriptional regulator [Lysobacter sp. TY2-98]